MEIRATGSSENPPAPAPTSAAPAAPAPAPSDHPPSRRRLVKASSLNVKRDRSDSVPPSSSPQSPSPSPKSRPITKGDSSLEHHAKHQRPLPVALGMSRRSNRAYDLILPPSPAPSPSSSPSSPSHSPPAQPASSPSPALPLLPSKQQNSEEMMRIQQQANKHAARAQSYCWSGNYKSVDSQFGNYLLPVIPVHLVAKSSSPAPSASPSSSPSPSPSPV